MSEVFGRGPSAHARLSPESGRAAGMMMAQTSISFEAGLRDRSASDAAPSKTSAPSDSLLLELEIELAEKSNQMKVLAEKLALRSKNGTRYLAEWRQDTQMQQFTDTGGVLSLRGTAGVTKAGLRRLKQLPHSERPDIVRFTTRILAQMKMVRA